DLDVSLIIHFRQVTGVHPAIGVDRLGGGLVIIPVTEHDTVTARAQFANGTAGDRRALGVDNLVFQMWLGLTDGRHAPLQFVIGAGLHRYRTGFGHAVSDL